MSKKIILVTHHRIYSAPQALRDYIRKIYNRFSLLFISHPLPLRASGFEEKSYFEKSIGQKITGKASFRRKDEWILVSSFRDFVFSLIWSLKEGKCDIFIGVDNLNALVGIILKKLGRVEMVVYYTIDYFPTRFENKFLNYIYHFIDKICVGYSDETWNVSSVMVTAREKYNNMDRKTYNKQYTVPIGIWYESAPRKDFSKVDKRKLIFVGHLLSHMGVDLVIKTMPLIIKKIPGIKLEIIGGGEEEENLRKLSKDLKLDKYIKFWGWVKDRKKLEKIMSNGAVGLATFNTEILDEKVKNADPGKIKDYMLLGMPVIVTDAISNTSDIKNSKSGIVIRYNSSDLVDAVVQLLGSNNRLRQYRDNALKYVSQFDFNLIFDKNLKRIIGKLNK